jgi:hypothetical protein
MFEHLVTLHRISEELIRRKQIMAFARCYSLLSFGILERAAMSTNHEERYKSEILMTAS